MSNVSEISTRLGYRAELKCFPFFVVRSRQFLLTWVLFIAGCSPASNLLELHTFSEGTLQWEQCGPYPSPLFDGQPRGECSLNEVPLRWDTPSIGSIAVVVRRFEPSVPRRGTLWMLDGGPGQTGLSFNTPVWRSISTDRGWALMIISHRGSGLSTPLFCPMFEAAQSDGGAFVTASEQPACAASLSAQWRDDLGAFNSYEAARDLAHFIRREQRPNESTYVWGGSYGAYWALRLFENAPRLIDAAILEGLVPPDADFVQLGRSVDEAARVLLEQCEADTTCSRHFPGGIKTAIESVIAHEEANSGCTAALGVTVEERQYLFGATLLADRRLRSLLAPLLLRWNRCRAGDQVVLRRALETFPKLAEGLQPTPTLNGSFLDPQLRNLRLSDHILQRDLIRSNLSVAQVIELEKQQLASSPTTRKLAGLRTFWPKPTYPQQAPGRISTDIPLLLMAGDHDAQTPLSWSQRVAAFFQGPHQNLVVVPHAGHMTFNEARSTGGENCTIELYKRFMDNPRNELELSCFLSIPLVDLSADSPATRALSEEFFGTPDPWGAP